MVWNMSLATRSLPKGVTCGQMVSILADQAIAKTCLGFVAFDNMKH